MFLSKRSNGYYYVFYDKPDGKRTCISTKCKKKQEALKFLSNFQYNLKERERLNLDKIALKDFAYEYLKYSESVHSWKTTKDYKNTFNQLLKYFGNILLIDISTRKLNSFLQFRSKTSLYVSSKDLRYLRSAFNWAMKNHYLSENPCNYIKSIKVPEKSPLYLSEIEFECLIRVVECDDFRDVFTFAINTGLRQMELLTLKWNQIDFKNQMLTLDNREHVTKSKKPRSVPLNLKAIQILTDRQIKSHSSEVFTFNENTIKPDFISKTFKKCVLKAGLNPKLKFHSLRTSFGSWLVQRGCGIYDVMRLMGHSDVRVTTQHYASLTSENLRNSVNLLNN